MRARIGMMFVLMQVTGERHDTADVPTAIRDESKVWETIAAAQYKVDGNDAGWESDVSDEETADDKYIRVRAAYGITAVRGTLHFMDL